MAEQPNEDNASGEKAKGNGKMIVFTIAIVPLIAALSFFLVVKVINPYFAPSASANSADDQASPETNAANDDTNDDGFLYELGTVMVNPAGGRSIRIMKVGVSIEVTTKSFLKEVEKLRPKLQHQLIMVLSSKQIDEISSPEGKAKLQSELRDVFESELGASPGEIRQVYFGEFIIQ